MDLWERFEFHRSSNKVYFCETWERSRLFAPYETCVVDKTNSTVASRGETTDIVFSPQTCQHWQDIAEWNWILLFHSVAAITEHFWHVWKWKHSWERVCWIKISPFIQLWISFTASQEKKIQHRIMALAFRAILVTHEKSCFFSWMIIFFFFNFILASHDNKIFHPRKYCKKLYNYYFFMYFLNY